MLKKCKKCEVEKDESNFSKAGSTKDGYSSSCKPCVVLRNQLYWRTLKGRVSQIYANQIMSSKQRKHVAPAYTRDELGKWVYAHGFEVAHSTWKDSGYLKDLVPSIDRLDSTKPYTLQNIRLVTWADNNEKAYTDRKTCVHITAQNKGVNKLTLQGDFISSYGSISAAARENNITRININDVCRGKKSCLTAGGYKWEYSES